MSVGQGTGPTVLTGVECNGLENKLFDCYNGGMRTSYCTHARVTCVPGKIMNYFVWMEKN